MALGKPKHQKTVFPHFNDGYCKCLVAWRGYLQWLSNCKDTLLTNVCADCAPKIRLVNHLRGTVFWCFPVFENKQTYIDFSPGVYAIMWYLLKKKKSHNSLREEGRALHSYQVPGTSSSRPDLYLKPPSFLPLCPQLSHFFISPYYTSDCVSLDVVHQNLMQTHMQALSFMSGQMAWAGETGKQIPTNIGPQHCQRSKKLCSTQSVWHHCSTWCQVSDSCAFSEDSVFHSTCSPWLALAVGSEARDQSQTSDALNKERDKHIAGRGPMGQRWLYKSFWG